MQNRCVSIRMNERYKQYEHLSIIFYTFYYVSNIYKNEYVQKNHPFILIFSCKLKENYSRLRQEAIAHFPCCKNFILKRNFRPEQDGYEIIALICQRDR